VSSDKQPPTFRSIVVPLCLALKTKALGISKLSVATYY